MSSINSGPASFPFPASIGVVFDWDGVVIDSHDQHERSWFLLAGEVGKTLTHELFKTSFGMRNETIIPLIFKWADEGDTEAIRSLADQKEELYRELLRADGIEPLAGVRELLTALQEAGIPASIGSSTPRKNIETALEITGLSGAFDALTAAEDVSHGKPDPEVFLKAAERIQRAPESCVVFEDSHVGIQAGLAAGMRTIAVTTTHARETFSKINPHRIVDSLAEVTVAQLADLFIDTPATP